MVNLVRNIIQVVGEKTYNIEVTANLKRFLYPEMKAVILHPM